MITRSYQSFTQLSSVMRSRISSDAAVRGLLWLLVGIQTIILVVVSQVGVTVGDEGFYLLAAQLVNAGKRPYIDFFYQHPPLFLYIFAGWMRVFGPTWHSAHCLAALLFGGVLLLVGNLVFEQLRVLKGYQPFVFLPVWLMGSSILALMFGTQALPYSLALFLLVVAFRLVIKVAERPSGAWTLAAGCFAGAAAMSILLVLPALPVLAFWLVRYTLPGSRFRRFCQFCCGAALPLIMIVWLAAQGPRQVFFDLIEFQLLYRRVAGNWTDWEAFKQSIRVLMGWLQSSQAMILSLFAILGSLFLYENDALDQPSKRIFSLAIWLGIGLSAFSSIAMPTFEQYYIFTIPFLSISASIGIYGLCVRVIPRFPSILLVLALMGLYTSVSVIRLYEYNLFTNQNQAEWQQIDDVANVVNRVKGKDSLIFAPSEVYVASQIVPLSGLENIFTQLLPAEVALDPRLHVVMQDTIDGWLKSGYFAIVVIANDDPRVEELDLKHVYRQSEEIQKYYTIFWDPRR